MPGVGASRGSFQARERIRAAKSRRIGRHRSSDSRQHSSPFSFGCLGRSDRSAGIGERAAIIQDSVISTDRCQPELPRQTSSGQLTLAVFRWWSSSATFASEQIPFFYEAASAAVVNGARCDRLSFTSSEPQTPSISPTASMDWPGVWHS